MNEIIAIIESKNWVGKCHQKIKDWLHQSLRSIRFNIILVDFTTTYVFMFAVIKNQRPFVSLLIEVLQSKNPAVALSRGK